MTRNTFIKTLKIGLIAVLAMIVIGYGLWRSLNYTKGPNIEIFEPQPGISTTTSFINLQGQAQRINSLTLNDNPILIDENGYFKVPIIIFRGLNVITLVAHDQFGRGLVKSINIVKTI